jgi:hypothetical protein
MNDEGLADAAAVNLFRLPRFHPGIRWGVRFGPREPTIEWRVDFYLMKQQNAAGDPSPAPLNLGAT